MYQLFKDNTTIRNYKNEPASFINLRTIMLREISRVKAYHCKSNYVVNGDHLINQLLLHLNVSTERDIESYVRICGIETERLARVFNLVHPVVSKPEINSGHFYNSDTKEFIILHSEEFDYNRAYNKWDKLVPIKVHSHNFTDVDFRIPDGKYTNSNYEGGYSVISINLPMLALQYKAWLDKVRSKQEYKTQTVNFIYQYPLVNMLDRHLEITIINRLMNMYYGKPVAKYKSAHPIVTTNVDIQLDNILNSRIKIIKSGKYKFDQLFTMFEGLKRRDWLTILRPIDISPVRSVKWVLELQVLDYFEFFVHVRKDVGGNYNNMELTRAVRDIINLNYDSTYFKSAYRNLNDKLYNLKILIQSS